MKKLFVAFFLSAMLTTSVSMAGGCGGTGDHDHDAKKKVKKYESGA